MQTKYNTIVRSLKTNIVDGVWGPGSQLPTERALEKELKSSRPTVSKALAQLVAEGWVTRQQGRGTFVAEDLPFFGAPVQLWYYQMPGTTGIYEGHQAVITNLQAKLQEHGRQLLIHFHNPINKGAHPNFGEHDTSGLVTIGPVEESIVKRWRDAGKPVLVLDHDTAIADCVILDHIGFAQMVEQVIPGQENIMYVGSRPGDDTEWPNSKLRRKLIEWSSGVTFDPKRYFVVDDTDEREWFKAHQSELERFDALIVDRATLADYVFQANKPKNPNLKVITIGSGKGISQFSYDHPDFSICDADWNHMGQVAGELLLNSDAEDDRPNRKVSLPFTWIC